MSGKFKIVVSDLHLSAGREAEGNPLDDFGSDREFADLLSQVAAESDRDGKEVELIVNGDAFEMLQVPHVEPFDPQKVYLPTDYHSSAEVDSVRKMAHIVDGHRPFFDALRAFIQVGPPRRSVTFVKGNHDLNLHWPGVQDRIRAAIGATGAKAPLLAFEARCISREGIYVEHGNQYAEVVDRVKDMEEPYDQDNPGQLAIPLGSWFVMDVFNDVERDKYWIDGVKPITALVWYALKYDFCFAARAIVTLASRLPGILKEGLFEVEETRAEALARQLEDPQQVEALAAQYEADAAFREQFNADVAALLAPARSDIDAPPPVPEPDPEAMGAQIQARAKSSLYEWAGKCALAAGVKLVTFGHTHDASVEDLPGGGVYINSGTWTWRADFTGAGKETWKDLFDHPERFTDDCRLNYVRIDYDAAGEPHGQLLAYQPSVPDEGVVEEIVEQAVSLWERFLAWLRGLAEPRRRRLMLPLAQTAGRAWGVVLLALILLVVPGLQGAAQGAPFTFVVTADMRQFAGSGSYDTASYFRGACEAIDALGPGALMVVPGDLDPPAGVEWTIETYLGAAYAWYPVVGNHEAETPADMDWLRAFDYGAVNPGPAGCPETTYSFDLENVHLVMLNVYCDAGGDTATTGDVPDHLYNWLVADLAATDRAHILVFGHEPAYPQPDADNGRLRHLGDSLDQYPANRDRFWTLLHDQGVVAYIVGHTHNYSAVRISDVWQLDAGHARGAGDTGAPSTFLLVHVDGDVVTFDTYRDVHDGVYDYADIMHHGTLSPGPTGVTLVSFQATALSNGVLVSWQTLAEFDLLGFNIYRAESPAEAPVQVNPSLIAVQQPGGPPGAAYTYWDGTAASGETYYYWLDVVDNAGGSSRYGPALAVARPGQRLYLPLIVVAPEPNQVQR